MAWAFTRICGIGVWRYLDKRRRCLSPRFLFAVVNELSTTKHKFNYSQNLKNYEKIALLIISFFALSININAQETARNSNTGNSGEKFVPHWQFAMEGIGYGFLKDGCDWEILSIGANYYFNEKAFIGARIGYKIVTYQSSSIQPYNFVTSDYECDYISIPIELGYVIYNGSTIQLVPFAGAALNIGWDGESEFSYNGHKQKKTLIFAER